MKEATEEMECIGVTQKQLKDILYYDSNTGIFKWKISKRGVRKNKVAGSITSHNYNSICINGKPYYAHRLAWLYMYGDFPVNYIDHINQDTLDNRIENLREVDNQCNMINTTPRNDNITGVKGVHWSKRKRKWCSQITLNQKTYFLTYSSNFTEAVAHRLAAEQCLSWSNCVNESSAFKYIQDYLKGGKVKNESCNR